MFVRASVHVCMLTVTSVSEIFVLKNKTKQQTKQTQQWLADGDRSENILYS